MTVGKLLSSVQPIPHHSLLLGQCKDSLPFLMDLSDPAVGSILISGDQGCGKTHHLQVMIDSALRSNTPGELQISILTHNPHDWVYLQENKRYKRYVQDIQAWYDHRAERTIQTLTELAEARRDGEKSAPMVIFILDDINFIQGLSYEAQVNLRWLLAYGSQSGVWLIATVKSDYADSFGFWLEPFRTRILGRVRAVNNAQILAMRNDYQAIFLEPSEFRVWSGTNWMTYRLPILGD
ncbi:MAG: hypothetical protein U9R53_02990 [Chloroflexota bacterium]|nr:hypothetical protein [Chloroflexota bacterium]